MLGAQIDEVHGVHLPSGRRPSRIASTMSGASSVTRSTRLIYPRLTLSRLANSSIVPNTPSSSIRCHRNASALTMALSTRGREPTARPLGGRLRGKAVIGAATDEVRMRPEAVVSAATGGRPRQAEAVKAGKTDRIRLSLWG